MRKKDKKERQKNGNTGYFPLNIAISIIIFLAVLAGCGSDHDNAANNDPQIENPDEPTDDAINNPTNPG